MRGLIQFSLLTLLLSLLSACVIDQNLSQPDVYLCNSDDDCIRLFCEESTEEEDQEVVGFCVPIDDEEEEEETDVSDPSDATDATDPTMQRTKRMRQTAPMPVSPQTVPTQARPPTRRMQRLKRCLKSRRLW